MDSKPPGAGESKESLIYRGITESDLAHALRLLDRSESFIRPTITTASLLLDTVFILGCFHKEHGLVGLGILQDFGIRKLLSEIVLEPDYEGNGIEVTLAKKLLVRVACQAPGRVLSISRQSERENQLRSLGFEAQKGEYYLRRRLNGGADRALHLAAPAGLRLEAYSPALVAEALSLWSTEEDMHLPGWESFDVICSVVESRGLLFALRDEKTAFVVGTILASIQGEDAMLYHLYVSRQHRRCGAGRFLARTTLDALAVRGCASALLCVHDARAMRFWESLGFASSVSDRLLQLDVSATSE